jgi:hypothetical protein
LRFKPEPRAVPNRTVKSGRHRFLWRQWPIVLCFTLGFRPVAVANERPAARDFSADIVSRAAGEADATIGKIYVSKRQVRIEIRAAPSGYFLIRDAGAFYVRPTQGIFMDAKLSTPLTQVFVPVSPEDPCREWRAAALLAGGKLGAWKCVLAQDQPAHSGKREFRVMPIDRHSSRRWVDAALDFPVTLLNDDGARIALEHIRIEAQPNELFALPPGYRKFDPDALIERMKRSDVWAAP